MSTKVQARQVGVENLRIVTHECLRSDRDWQNYVGHQFSCLGLITQHREVLLTQYEERVLPTSLLKLKKYAKKIFIFFLIFLFFKNMFYCLKYVLLLCSYFFDYFLLCFHYCFIYIYTLYVFQYVVSICF